MTALEKLAAWLLALLWLSPLLYAFWAAFHPAAMARLVLCTLAGFAFARFAFAGHNIAFGLLLRQAGIK